MSAALRLFRIEARRTPARGVALLAVGLTALLLWDMLGNIDVLLWPSSSVLARGAVRLLGGP
ncbi:MAG: hypothetical protein M3220_06140, partial [Chloroflexota bacterium]|nr:hypothetical protein [Chloroflexota bacterium]